MRNNFCNLIFSEPSFFMDIELQQLDKLAVFILN